jgi:hypothetical protein
VDIEDRLAAGRNDCLSNLGREELVETAYAFDLAELGRDPFLEGFVPRGELGSPLRQPLCLRSHGVV